MNLNKIYFGLGIIMLSIMLMASECDIQIEDDDAPHITQPRDAIAYTCDEVTVTNNNFILELRYGGQVYTFTPDNSPSTLDNVPRTEIEVRAVGEKNNICPRITLRSLGVPIEGGEEIDDFFNIFTNTQNVGQLNETYCKIVLNDKLLEPLADSGYVAIDFESGGGCSSGGVGSIQVNLNYEE